MHTACHVQAQLRIVKIHVTICIIAFRQVYNVIGNLQGSKSLILTQNIQRRRHFLLSIVEEKVCIYNSNRFLKLKHQSPYPRPYQESTGLVPRYSISLSQKINKFSCGVRTKNVSILKTFCMTLYSRERDWLLYVGTERLVQSFTDYFRTIKILNALQKQSCIL